MAEKMSGAELRAYRENRQLDQAGLAAWLNERLNRRYDRNKVSAWETGSTPIPDLVSTVVRDALTSRSRPSSGPARIVAFANQKGGVAKTTSALNTAILLAQRGKRVLLVDCDPQGSATLHLGEKPLKLDEQGKTLTWLLTRDTPTAEAIVPVCDGQFDLIPSSISLAEAEASLVTNPLAGGVLQGKLEEVVDRYDVLLLDCPPNLGYISVTALAAADALIVPCQTEGLAYAGIASLFSTVDKVRRFAKKNIRLLGILPTLYNARRIADQEVLGRLQRQAEKLNVRLFTPVRDAADYGKSFLAGRPVLELNPKAAGAESYAEIADAIIALTVETQNAAA
ncbi:AAA family ATPase [Azospirillum thermophilum]|uniref:Chromosome partitioning protein ParA n=1 Tax=Azospirillum thermophilum TaxID=2202148 RepID=A0A2S2CZN0_9PROT|nr:AAA family ATPase [Azospirillum thermophilum]AWK89860.1 chromosome partitioning protein [Azospirillum thermophilum]